MSRKTALSFFLLFVAATFSSISRADVINFANFTSNTYTSYGPGSAGYYGAETYSEQGVTFSSASNSVGLIAWGPGTFSSYLSSAILSDCATPLEATSGQTFNLLSTDFADVFNRSTSNVAGTVIGTRADGSTVSQSFDFANPTGGFHTVDFAGFTGLNSVAFEIGSDQMTNFTFGTESPDGAISTPLPSSGVGGLLLLGCGAIFAAWRSRRRLSSF